MGRFVIWDANSLLALSLLIVNLHVRVHLAGEGLDELGDELVAEGLALVRHQADGDEVARAVKHLLQLLLQAGRQLGY